MRKVVVNFNTIKDGAIIPKYANIDDSGMDIFNMNGDTEFILKPLERRRVDTGLTVDIPAGYEIQVRPKSGLAINKGISVVNTPGTIDRGYKGEISVVLVNLSNENVEILPGQKIAQLVVCPVAVAQTVAITLNGDVNKDLNNLDEFSIRGEGGFGSTGIFNK